MSEPYSLCAAVAVSTLVAAASVSVAADDLVSRLAPCLACHGEKGKSELPEVPSLRAQNAPYTPIQLYLFRPQKQAPEQGEVLIVDVIEVVGLFLRPLAPHGDYETSA